MDINVGLLKEHRLDFNIEESVAGFLGVHLKHGKTAGIGHSNFRAYRSQELHLCPSTPPTSIIGLDNT